MKKIGIVYFSNTDITENLADAIAKGVLREGRFEILSHKISGHEIAEGRFTNLELLDSLNDCNAIIFGSPTYMGGPSAQFKAFADASSEIWCDQKWAGKIAAGFTCGSALNGDQGSTLQYFVTFASQHGMLWLGLDSAHSYKDHGVNRLGCQLGVVAHSTDNEIHTEDLKSAVYLGSRVAKYMNHLNY